MSEAARQLDLSPTSVVQQMRALEAELGTPLLLRAGRTVRATEAGYRLIERAESIVRDTAGLRSWVHGNEVQQELHVGTINTVLHSALPDILKLFIERHPNTRVSVRSGVASQLYDLVVNGAVDVALTLKPAFDLPKTLGWKLLREEPLILLVPQHLGQFSPLQLLREQPLIRYDRTLGGGKLADDYLRDAGIAPHERLELNSLLAISMMVERGLGVAIVPDIDSPLLDGKGLVRLVLPQAGSRRALGLLWLRVSPRTGLIDSFSVCSGQAMQRTPGN